MMVRGSLIVAMVVVSGVSAARAQDTFSDAFWRFRTTTGFDFSSGSYGAAKATEVLYVPVTLQASKGPWTLKGDVSWLRVSGPALLLDGSSVGTVPVRTTGYASGPGDINLYARYSVEGLADKNLFLDITGRVKIPTASFTKGLGTGEWDQSLQLDIASVFGKIVPFAALGYRLTGEPAGFTLRNIVYGTLGVQYTWSQGVSMGVYYDVRQSAIPTAAAPQEGTAYLNVKLNERLSVNVYGMLGFSKNSPDAGGGTFLTYQW